MNPEGYGFTPWRAASLASVVAKDLEALYGPKILVDEPLLAVKMPVTSTAAAPPGKFANPRGLLGWRWGVALGVVVCSMLISVNAPTERKPVSFELSAAESSVVKNPTPSSKSAPSSLDVSLAEQNLTGAFRSANETDLPSWLIDHYRERLAFLDSTALSDHRALRQRYNRLARDLDYYSETSTSKDN